MRKCGSLLLCLIGGWLALISCAMKKMPESELVSVEYTRSGTMAGYEYEGRVEKDSTGGFVLRAMQESYGPLYEKRLNAEELKYFLRIIEEEKMFKYKESYRPAMEVLDGWSWSFDARFADGSSIASHGSNASPSGEGLKRIRTYMSELARKGVQVETNE